MIPSPLHLQGLGTWQIFYLWHCFRRWPIVLCIVLDSFFAIHIDPLCLVLADFSGAARSMSMYSQSFTYPLVISITFEME